MALIALGVFLGLWAFLLSGSIISMWIFPPKGRIKTSRPLPLSKSIRLCSTHALSPTAYQEMVEALKISIPALTIAKEDYHYDSGNAIEILKQALAQALAEQP